MKKMNIVRNTITEGTETYRERSRIGSINHRIWSVIAPMLFMAFGLFGVNVEAWGETATLSAKSSSVTKNGVTFSLDGSYTINNILVDYTYTGSGKEATLTWSAPGYTISVSQISINAKNYRSLGTTGKGQYKTSKNSSYTQFCNKNGWDTYTLESSSYFSLGNDGSITIKAVDKELQYKDIVFTYTQTAKSYTITLDDNKGSGGDATHEVTYNSAIGNLTNTPTKTGYHFMGYYTGEGGTGTQVFGSDGKPVKNVSGYTSNDNSPKWVKADDVTLYAKWEANTYKVRFNGNHASSGSMSDQDFTYGADAKALTANAFTRSYSITYDANGGTCSPTAANTNATSTFAGWNTKEEGNGTTYTNQQQVSNLTSKHGDVFNLYAQWTGGATLPSATNGKRELVGWYDANDNFVGAAGTTYAPTSNVTLTAKWAEKKVPGFIGSGQELQLGGTYSGFQFSNTTTATPSSSPTAKFHYVITEQTVQGNSTGTPNPGKVILFDGTTITAVNKGTAKIKFVQLEDEDNNIEDKESGEFTFTVTKFTPVFTWNAQTYYFNNTYANIFSSTNHDTEITCTSDNEDAAEMFAGSTAYQKTLKTFTDISATITISQAENYKWEPMTVDNYVVYNNKVSNHVAFDYTQAMYNDNTITTAKVSAQGTAWTDSRVRLGGSNTALVCSESTSWADKYIDIKFTGYPHKLTFKIAVNDSKVTSHKWYVKESSNGTNWSGEIWSSEHNGVDVYSSEEVELNPDTRYVRICYAANYAGYVKDIHISQLEYFRRKGENTTLNFATNLKDHVPAVQSFVVEHANAGYQTTVTAPDHYAVSLDNVNFASEVVYSTNATALTGGDKKGTFVVYVKYLADAEGTHAGNVVVHNNLRTDFNVPVTGTTQGKYATTLHAKGTATFGVDAANVAATDLFEVRDPNGNVIPNVVITLSKKEETNVVHLANSDTELDPNCGGNTTIIAHYAGDDETYAAAEDSEREITITRLADLISFGNGKIVLIAGNEEELSTWNITSSSQEEGATLTFSSSNSSVLRVEGGKIIAVSKGEAKLYATSQNTCTFAEGIDSLTIKVRNSDDPCETTSYLNTSKTQIKSDKSLERTITEGMHQTLTVSVRAQLLAASSNTSTIELLNKDNGVLFTHTFKRDSMSMTPKTYSYNLSGIANIQTAKTIRITGNGSTYYQEYDLIKITQQRYLNHTGAKNIAMTSVKACEEATHDISINYSDVSTIQMTHHNNDFSYTVMNGNSNGEFNNDCGDFGTFTLRATVNPLTKGTYKDSIFLSAAGLHDTIVLSLEATKPEREIVWELADISNATATTNTTLDASVRTTLCQETAGNVTYTIHAQSSEGVASLSGNVLSFHKQGTVTVKASAAETDDYLAAADVVKTWSVSKVGVQMRTLPLITSTITYGDTKSVVNWDNESWVAEDVLANEKVDGSIAYVGPDNFNAAGITTLTFNFTPSNVNTYDVLQFTVPVTVQKAETTLSWTANPASVVYGNTATYAASSESDGTITYSIKEGNEYASIDANTGVLTVIEAGHTVIVQASQAAGTNYVTPQAITTEVTLNKAEATLSWATAPESVEYGATDVVYTASSASDGAITYSIIAGDDCASIDGESGALTITKAGSFTVQASQAAGTNHVAPEAITKDVTITKITPELTWTAAPTELAYNATGVIYEASSTSSEGAITYSIASGNLYANIDANSGELTIVEPGHTITVQASQAESDNYNAPTSITVQVTIGAAPTTNTFKGDGNWDDPANWESGIVPTGDPDIFVTGDLVIDKNITVGNLTIESTGSVAVISGGTLTVNGTSEDRTEYGDVHVMSDGALALGDAANLQVRDFTLDASLGNSSNAATSGQVSGDIKLHINRDAYFQMSFDPRGAIDYGWYDFTVPFEVEVLNGVYDKNMNKLANGPDYVVMNYNEARRASSGKGWGSFTGTMQPGRIYSIGFDDDRTWNTFIFKKKSGSNLLSNGSFTAECSNVGAADDRGWNGLGNGTLQHRELTGLGSRKVQVYNHSEDNYTTYDADEKAYAVGTAFFLQADEYLSSISLTATDGSKALRAPKYASRELDEFRLTLTAEGDDRYADRMWVSASDEATGEYVIGHDLLKMGTPKNAKVAQMWTVSNDLRLCDIEMPLMDDKAQCPISFFAPNAQTYEIAVDQAPEDATLYLTYNDRIIWSLSASPYTIDLAKGMTEGYGLRIVARHHSPSVATGMDELNVDQDGNRKVLIDNMLYIITPEGAMFSVTGEKVK